MAQPRSTDFQRVKGWLSTGAIKHTLDPATPNSVDLARFIARANGASPKDLPHAGPIRPAAEAALQRAVGPVGQHFLFVLLDGMGMNLLEATLPPTSFLRRHLAQQMHSVFPATTTAALNSLASALHPSVHGLPGWTIRTTASGTGCEITATPLPFIEDGSAAPLDTVGVDASEIFRAPPIYNTYRRSTHQISAYAGSEFSDYSTGWCPSTKSNSVADAISAVAARWNSATRETFTYWYNAEPDGMSHKYGWSSEHVAAELVALDAALEQLWFDTEGTCGNRTMIVSADHGHLECRGEQIMVLGEEPEDRILLSLMRCNPTVEPRTPAFHVRRNDDPSLIAISDRGGDSAQLNRELFAAAFRDSRFSRHFALLTIDEADALELFGPVRQSVSLHSLYNDCSLHHTGVAVVVLYPSCCLNSCTCMRLPARCTPVSPQ